MSNTFSSLVIHLASFRRLRSAVFWFFWFVLLSAPLLWIRIAFDEKTRQYVAQFHSDRFAWWTKTFPIQAISSWPLWLAVAISACVWALRHHARGVVCVWRRPFEIIACRWQRAPFMLRVAAGWIVAPAVVFAVCAQLSDQQRGWGVFVGIYVLLAMGLNLTVGMTGLLVLGYAAFYAIGAYTFGILHHFCGVSFWAAFAPAAAVGALVGLLLGLPSIRLRGDYLAIVTLGFGEVLRILLKNLKERTLADGSVISLTGGDEGIFIVRSAMFPKLGALPLFPEGVSREASGFFVMVALVALSLWLVRNLVHSRIGRAWIAIREDETAAAAMGIPIFRLKLLAFSLSAAWASVAGVCFAAYQGHIVPDSFGFTESIFILSMVILGGMGTVSGPVVGATVFYLSYELLRIQLPALTDYRLMIFGALMAALMVFRPQGILGSRQRKIELGLE